VFAQLVTSAVVATRGPKLALSFGGGQYGVLGVGSTGVASNTYALAWVPGAGAAGAAGALTGPLPDLTLETGYTLGSLTLALDVGDQYSAVYILAEITEVRGGDVDLGDQPSMVVEVVASSTGS
jgi:hypothetical protein